MILEIRLVPIQYNVNFRNSLLLSEDHPLCILIKKTFTVSEYEIFHRSKKNGKYTYSNTTSTIEESHFKSKEFENVINLVTTLNIENTLEQDIIDRINNDFEISKEIKSVAINNSDNKCYQNDTYSLINIHFYIYFGDEIDGLEYYLFKYIIKDRETMESLMVNKGLSDESISTLLYEKDRFKHVKSIDNSSIDTFRRLANKKRKKESNQIECNPTKKICLSRTNTLM